MKPIGADLWDGLVSLVHIRCQNIAHTTNRYLECEICFLFLSIIFDYDMNFILLLFSYFNIGLLDNKGKIICN